MAAHAACENPWASDQSCVTAPTQATAVTTQILNLLYHERIPKKKKKSVFKKIILKPSNTLETIIIL